MVRATTRLALAARQQKAPDLSASRQVFLPPRTPRLRFRRPQSSRQDSTAETPGGRSALNDAQPGERPKAAQRDPVTALGNRHFFEQKLHQTLVDARAEMSELCKKRSPRREWAVPTARRRRHATARAICSANRCATPGQDTAWVANGLSPDSRPNAAQKARKRHCRQNSTNSFLDAFAQSLVEQVRVSLRRRNACVTEQFREDEDRYFPRSQNGCEVMAQVMEPH